MAAVNVTCPRPMVATSNGLFQGDSPLEFALPLLILQICLVVVLTRTLAFLLRPLRQPRVIAEIVGGVLLGPSALGRNKAYLHAVFPPKSIPVLDTLANVGLLYFLFLSGLEIDPKALRRTGKKAVAVAFAGISLPFLMGIGSSFVLRATVSKGVNSTAFLVYMGVALSITAFPVLARILAELKLLTTDLGRMAMSAAAVNDVVAWVLLALAIAISGSGKSPLISVWVLFSGCAFVVLSILIVRPIFKWIARRCQEGEPVEETYVCGTLVAVLAAGFLTDLIGIHAMFGAFVFGVLIPKEGPLAGALVEKVEDLVSGLFLPLFFVSSGLKTNVATIQGLQSWGLLCLVICTACFGKIVGTFGISLLCKIPVRESLALGFLMNTKGLVELIVLNIGKDRKVLNDQTFAIMVLMALFTTFITTPLVLAVYKPARKSRRPDYKHRTIERKNTDTQLRILACFHSTRNIPSMINLLESSRGVQKVERLCVYALHLMELSERSSAILMVHKARKNGLPFWNKGRHADSNQVVVAFEAFQQLSNVSVRPMTAISSMTDMHEDICATAERKRAALIILPFHKQQRIDGSLETCRTDLRWVNRRVLAHSPCSVGILVDRGLGGTTHVSASNVSYLVRVLFFGGRDDREALAYGLRMAEHPGISLEVIRFIVKADEASDEDVLSELKEKASKDESVKYVEKVVKNRRESVDAIQEVRQCNLFLVGGNPEGDISLLLNRQNEYEELGVVGGLLTCDSTVTASVLVIQQYHHGQVSTELNPHSGEDKSSSESS
ncbi:Cation/H(+) antiporter 18 [Linum perenne]